ncbi:hypothetical protein C8R43DRAFT_969563 [Mycena crocata]|nr:hypothetical protein C8R43DRAFT_969563 [Mycena crocata]
MPSSTASTAYVIPPPAAADPPVPAGLAYIRATEALATAEPSDLDAAQLQAQQALTRALEIAYPHTAAILRLYSIVVPGPVVSSLSTAMTRPSFRSLGDELNDLDVAPEVIVDFRRQWRRLHFPGDSLHQSPEQVDFAGDFGSLMAQMVDDLNVDDPMLLAVTRVWRGCHKKGMLPRGTFYNQSFPRCPSDCLFRSDEYVFNS